ncbi:hypothetical protein L1049_022050 [Liquidambar formosana]|uniref:Uncharacterized protein n=1 Tax=Liquidambar formosana TaxID=63359 RepID=A0AAP0RDV1_LIQFO
MEQRLKEAAQEGNINKLYELIREDPCLLEPIDQKPFADTPLHIAAEAGHTHFALEIMRLKPSFARKLNPSGFSPMHLALQNGKTQTVTRLVNVDPELVRVKGREGVTSLHYITEEGDHNLLAEFITVCPKSVEDLTIRNETALHIAVKNYLPTALEVLLGGLHQLSISEGSQDLKRKVLDLKDEDGKTVLHIAKSNNQPQVSSHPLDFPRA